MTQNWTLIIESNWIFSKLYIYIYIYIYRYGKAFIYIKDGKRLATWKQLKKYQILGIEMANVNH